MLDPRLRLGRKQRALVTEMLEMGWLFTMVVRYIQNVDGERKGGTQSNRNRRCLKLCTFTLYSLAVPDLGQNSTKSATVGRALQSMMLPRLQDPIFVAERCTPQAVTPRTPLTRLPFKSAPSPHLTTHHIRCRSSHLPLSRVPRAA